MTRFHQLKKYITAACVAAVVVTCVTVPPLKAAVSNALNIFRVDSVKSIHITLEDIRQIRNQLKSKSGEISVENLGNFKRTGGQQKVLPVEEAKALADFPLLFPSDLAGTQPEVSVVEPAALEFTLNVDNMNEVLKSLGSEKLLPKSIDGATVKADFPYLVSAQYTAGGSRYNISQTKPPEILVPGTIDTDEIYEAVADLPIIPENLQQQLKSIKDWKSTLYLPVTDSNTVETDINGNNAYLYFNDMDSQAAGSAVIWYDNGIIRSVQGNVDKDELLKVARSMK